MSETKGLTVKGSSAKFCLVPVLIAGAGLLWTGSARAQIFTTLHHFTDASGSLYTNSDGANPSSGLIVLGSTLYGTASYGGTGGNGTVFRLNIDGTGFTNLHNFTEISGPLGTNSGGAYPYGALVLAGNTLYGATSAGGVAGDGTIFKVRMDGTGFTNLHSFTSIPTELPWTNSDGSSPNGGLILMGNTLYGTASYGGSAGNGTLFAINVNGTGFTNLHSFSAGIGNWPYVTNSEGAFPNGMILSGSTFYGTADSGGGAANGTVFAISTNGTAITTLHSFTAAPGIGPTNNDGVRPHGLLLSGNTLYGTANLGGSSSYGTVFALDTNATGFTNLYSFSSARFSTNGDGAYPNDGLVLLGNTLYGTAGAGAVSSTFQAALATGHCLRLLPMGQDSPTCTISAPRRMRPIATGFILMANLSRWATISMARRTPAAMRRMARCSNFRWSTCRRLAWFLTERMRFCFGRRMLWGSVYNSRQIWVRWQCGGLLRLDRLSSGMRRW